MKSPSCPNCQQRMKVTLLHCPACDIEVKGRFVSDRFSTLNLEDLLFMEQFVLSRGNLKELQESLSLSYPNVRNRLDKLVENLQKIHAQDHQEMQRELAQHDEEQANKAIISKHSHNH